VTAFNALVLAGSRSAHDPVAAYGHAPHKALIELQGQTLLARVVGALRAAGAARIAVVFGHPAVEAEAARLSVEAVPQAEGPSLSVQAGLDRLGTPLVVTTADHALLHPEWVRCFLADIPPYTDVAALVGERTVIEAAAPGTKRTYIHLADGRWSGCNLFYFANARALGVIELWRRVEAERKHPLRMAAILGLPMLLRYLFGRLSLAHAAARLGDLAGVKAVIVRSPFGLAAIDVDKPADLDLVRKLVGA
jgi:GTP:adenosylcobinamide-phosphate guanylyltransferase